MKLILYLSICILLTACGKKEPKQDRPQQQEPSKASAAPLQRIKYIEYPSQGILLGQGWDSFRKLGATNVCITFDAAIIPGHDIDIRFDEVFSRHQLNKSMRLSVSGGYSGFGGSASGRANFSNSLSVDRTNTNILATIQVLKGDEFAAPSLAKSIPKDIEGSNVNFSQIRLTDEALKVLSSPSRKREFSRLCGDSFIYHVRRGGRLNAYLTYSGLSEESKRSMSASLSASGWGASVSASSGLDSSKKDEAKLTSIRIFQSGGPLLPTPVNAAQFTEGVRQFLGSTDPDLFPTKPFEVGLLRYDALANWPRNNKLIDPEEMEDLVKFYWLFEDLRKQYSAALTSDHPHLVFQPETWDPTTETYAFVQDRLCKFVYNSILGQWKHVQFDTSNPTEAADCSSQETDPILNNPWVLRNVLSRMDTTKAAALFLRNSIDGCLDSEGTLDDCISDRALRKMRTRAASLIFSQAPPSPLAATLFGPRIAGPGNRSTQDNIDLALFLSTFPFDTSHEEIRQSLDAYSKKTKISALQGSSVNSLASSIRSFNENPRALLTAARLIAFEEYIRDSRNEDELDVTATILEYLINGEMSEETFWRKLSSLYYIASQLSPIRIGTKTSNTVTFDASFSKALSINPSTIKTDATDIRSAIRQGLAQEQIRFAESECQTNIGSPLCKSISDIRELLDTYDSSPLFSQKGSVKTVVVGYRKECREKWFGGGGSVYKKRCWREAVTQNVNEYLTELAATNIKF